MVKRNRRRPRLRVTGDGTGIVNHVGARLIADLAGQVGLTSALSMAMAPNKQRRRGHDHGEVLVDVAVSLADGGNTISDVAVLRDQPDLFGEVASHPTVWRTLVAVSDQASERTTPTLNTQIPSRGPQPTTEQPGLLFGFHHPTGGLRDRPCGHGGHGGRSETAPTSRSRCGSPVAEPLRASREISNRC